VNFQIVNPYNNKVVKEYKYDSYESAEVKLEKLSYGFVKWRYVDFDLRSEVIRGFANYLSTNKAALSALISSDMGKPIMQAEQEIVKSIECSNFYADNSSDIAKVFQGAGYIREPIGVVMGIMPWNFPVWQMVRFLIPALLAGNCCVLKPAFNCYRIAEFMNKFFLELDESVCDLIMTDDANTELLIKNDNVKGVSLTGSTIAGKKVALVAAEKLKPYVLELGGSDPFVIFPDADKRKAVSNLVSAKFLNSGQTCIAPKRIFIHEEIFQETIHQIIEKTKKYLRLGDPMDKSVNLGPIARQDLRSRLEKQIEAAELENGQIMFRADTSGFKGNFFAPMIIDARNLDTENILFKEEVFGPVMLCQSFKNYDDVITFANDSEFGLGASVWSGSKSILANAARDLNHGVVGLNSTVKSDPSLPFGGRKNSGFGIELGFEGVFSFTDFKTIIG
jgi:succinate-semialdehyde dehydrogenase / glutarate-semialdehyde dehydrogenase